MHAGVCSPRTPRPCGDNAAAAPRDIASRVKGSLTRAPDGPPGRTGAERTRRRGERETDRGKPTGAGAAPRNALTAQSRTSVTEPNIRFGTRPELSGDEPEEISGTEPNASLPRAPRPGAGTRAGQGTGREMRKNESGPGRNITTGKMRRSAELFPDRNDEKNETSHGAGAGLGRTRPGGPGTRNAK